MPSLDKNLFEGQHEIDNCLREREFNNFSSDIDDFFKRKGWDGKAAGCIGLKLSSDNGKVENGFFIVRGSISDEWIQISAKKIWPDIEGNLALFLRFRNADVFKFSDGGLASDITAQEEVEHGVFIMSDSRAPVPVLEASFEEWGIGEFSLRMLCVISKNSSAANGVLLKYTILVYPESKVQLLTTYEAAQSAAWPGVRVVEGELPMIPRPISKWRCPVNPLLMPGVSFASTQKMPPPDEIRAAVAAIMGRAVLPEVCRTGTAALARWKRIAERAEELSEKPGTVAWPKTGQQQQEQGKTNQKTFTTVYGRGGGGGGDA
jgi:hypothetical protein